MKDELTRIKQALIGTAAYYGQSLTETQLALYAEDLADYPADIVCAALKTARLDPRQQRFPLPSRIIEIIEPGIDTDAEAKEAAARILGAVKTFGWCNPTKARNYIGELGWAAIASLGGWENLCANLSIDQIPTYHAQIRELIKAKIARKASGIEDTAPGDRLGFLPENSNKRLSDTLSIVGKRISESK